jgi:hypothetical protein
MDGLAWGCGCQKDSRGEGLVWDARKTLVWDARKLTLREGLDGILLVFTLLYSYLLSCSGVAIAESACLVIVCSGCRALGFLE